MIKVYNKSFWLVKPSKRIKKGMFVVCKLKKNYIFHDFNWEVIRITKVVQKTKKYNGDVKGVRIADFKFKKDAIKFAETKRTESLITKIIKETK